MATIRKINVSQVDGNNPFQGGTPVLPKGTLVLYEDTNLNPSQWKLRLHDGVTAGGTIVPVLDSTNTLKIPGNTEISTTAAGDITLDATDGNVIIKSGVGTYTFAYDAMTSVGYLEIPFSIQGPDQTGFVSASGYGIDIDSANSPPNVNIGNVGGGKFLRIEDGAGLADVDLKGFGKITLRTDGDLGPLWTFNTAGGIDLPGGGSIATSNEDVAFIAGNDGVSTFGSVTINTQFPAASYTVFQQSSPGAFDAVYTTIAETPDIASIVPGMTVTGSGITLPTTVLSVTGPDEFGTYTINLTANGADLLYLQTYTFTAVEPQDRNWEFNSLGEMYLPQGGAIQENTIIHELFGSTTTAITLIPGGAAPGSDQRLEIYGTGGGEGDHIHIRSGDQSQTDLFLGNDTQYFAVGASGFNTIQARPGTDSPAPGTGAGAGGSVTISAGYAGDNGGDVNDGASGGSIFIYAGGSSAGVGGAVQIESGPGGAVGYGDIRLSTDGGVNFWSFKAKNILQIPGGVHERFETKQDATGTVEHDCSAGHIFYHTSPDANWTANFTNLNLSSTYATAVTIVIVQGGTGYYPNVVQISGVGQTINWQGNAIPTPSTNRTDVVTFSIINNSGTYTVLGQLTGF